ncbi:beta-ketoacyl-[acyl-carrier-protein] synthase family protein [Streptomyces afghaniensis]|uniref:beta-ketoacyl-[acyl-carrier-protein] synthase family protein n=1 Tax=Streptomyces afghaniensis TaxID=66865 RepID=UPI0027837631|nr:beta-ketoacyl-[acyl-carrier-protein] synthase family protein [Streptomyces afghaniensis]MDQ1015505.1 3-oxoacyl-[acyl-carrier-protein] synthase II [Streptomyces afghaniensis]
MTTGRSYGAADVAVTGVGLVTPAGIGVAENWTRIRNAEPTAVTDPSLAGLQVDIACRVSGFDAARELGRRKAWRLDRYVQLALVAAREAVTDSGLSPGDWDGARVAVVLGNALGGTTTYEEQTRRLVEDGPDQVSPMLVPMSAVNMVSGYVAMEFGATGPNLVTATACASGTTAVGTARDLLRSGACDVVITGGTESSITPTIVSGFARMGALSRRTGSPAAASRPFDADRDGFVIAEGAGVLVLERTADARARGARIRARISGYGASADAHHATAPDPQGTGAERAIRAALSDAEVLPDEIDHVNAHGTSTQLNDLIEAQVLGRVLGRQATVTSNKGVTGHSLGAAGAIEAAFTVLTVQEGEVPPTANLDSVAPSVDVDVVAKTPRKQSIKAALTNSFGFGGQNAVLVVTAA